MLKSCRCRLLSSAALVAAVVTAGCYPVVSNETAAQQDVIGPVQVSADVCTAPLALPIALVLAGGLIDPGNVRASAEDGSLGRRFERAGARLGLPGDLEELFGCLERDDLEELLGPTSGPLGVIAGLPHQVLVGYRVPKGATAPERFSASGSALVHPAFRLDGQPGDDAREEQIDLEFTRAPEMDAQMRELLPELFTFDGDAVQVLDDGDDIVGYVSTVLPGPLAGEITLDAAFGLPGAASDAPYGGPFNALTLLGTRIALPAELLGAIEPRRAALRALTRGPLGGPVDPGDLDDLVAALDGARPVDCLMEDDVVRGPSEAELIGKAWCPMPNLVHALSPDEQELIDAVHGTDVETRDLRVAGGEGFAEQGQTATVPFTLRTAGPASAEQLAMTASTAAAGATATPRQATTTFPATGEQARHVDVQIPADATPGTYAVTLTVAKGGAARTGTGRVVVLPKATSAASLLPGAPNAPRGRDNVYMDSQGNIAFGWICPPACGNARVDVTSPKAGIAPKANTAAVSKPRLLRIARGRFKATAGKRARVKVRLFPKARRAIRRGRTVKALIIVRSGANGRPNVRPVTIKRRRR